MSKVESENQGYEIKILKYWGRSKIKTVLPIDCWESLSCHQGGGSFPSKIVSELAGTFSEVKLV